jgi:uncharacterized protein
MAVRRLGNLDLKPVVHAVLEGYALAPGGTHGVGHWARVLENGLRLVSGAGVNPDIISLFAVLHDARRVDEYTDQGHGCRGARLTKQLRGTLFQLPDKDFMLLLQACAEHTDGGTEAALAVQICWDADRLDLPRVGLCIDPARLCTAAAKTPEMIQWATKRAVKQLVPARVANDWEIFNWSD